MKSKDIPKFIESNPMIKEILLTISNNHKNSKGFTEQYYDGLLLGLVNMNYRLLNQLTTHIYSIEWLTSLPKLSEKQKEILDNQIIDNIKLSSKQESAFNKLIS